MYYINSKKDKPDIGYMEATISKLMKRGIRLADCTNLKKYYTNLRDELKSDFSSKYNISNPNSSKQITDYLKYVSDKVDINSRNDIINICYDDETGKWTSNAEAMEKLADMGYEFAKDLLDYRHAKKYAESIESIVELADDDGLIHPLVSLGKTNRINYSKPGVMTIPKELLWNMLAPYKEGNTLYSVDIKNQEPSILINMTGADELKPALTSKEGLYETMFKLCFRPTATANVLLDTLPENRIYTIPELKHIGTISPAYYSAVRPQVRGVYYNGKRVVGIETVCVGSSKGVKPILPDRVSIELEDGTISSVDVEWESVDKKYKKGSDYTVEGQLKGLDIKISKVERKEFKQSWLALSYGASSFGIKQMCKNIDGNRVYQYITKINAIKNYRTQIDKFAKEGNNVIGTVFGSRLFAGDYNGDYKKLKRILLDLPIQGTGSDILSLLIKHFYEYTKQNGLTDKLSLYYTRHDELIIEVDKDFITENGDKYVEDILRDMLEHQINDWTPFQIEINKTEASKLRINFEE